MRRLTSLLSSARTCPAGLPSEMDESNVGIWLWGVLLVIVNATWIGMDIWLRRNGHEFLTTEFREGLKHPLWGPVLAFATAGTVAAFVWHMFIDKN
jgi:hypothetical protein